MACATAWIVRPAATLTCENLPWCPKFRGKSGIFLGRKPRFQGKFAVDGRTHCVTGLCLGFKIQDNSSLLLRPNVAMTLECLQLLFVNTELWSSSYVSPRNPLLILLLLVVVNVAVLPVILALLFGIFLVRLFFASSCNLFFWYSIFLLFLFFLFLCVLHVIFWVLLLFCWRSFSPSCLCIFHVCS